MSNKPQRYAIGYADGKGLPLTMKENNSGTWVAYSERLTPEEQAVIEAAKQLVKDDFNDVNKFSELWDAVKALQESKDEGFQPHGDDSTPYGVTEICLWSEIQDPNSFDSDLEDV